MVVIRPNPRRMRAFLDSPAERPGRLTARPGRFPRAAWERVLFAVGAGAAVAVAAVAVIAIVSH
ncbi:MAG TPA: hypothetical protein VG651_21750 [Stellaceae bacterium]|nr:hypothetical protein [Stellaceae bacterium]